jgi:capsular exopolysaccharide synthesis family protein
MNADSTDSKLSADDEPQDAQALEEFDEALHRALVMLYRLRADQVDEINELVERRAVRFAEAAVLSGVVTQSEVDNALDWVERRSESPGRSIVEEALFRRPPNRDLVVWETEKLKPARELILAHNQDHPRSELLRSLRTEILMRRRAQRASGIFALLSPNRGEGRSHLCAELAIAFAQLGGRTLLVDADLRRPRLHTLFGADNLLGLSQELERHKGLKLRGVEGLPQMALMTSGALPPNPLELLSSYHFERLVAEWRRNYEYVVIDTPATSECSDALAVARAVGQVVIVGRSAATPFSSLKNMTRGLQTTGAEIIGAVINSF